MDRNLSNHNLQKRIRQLETRNKLRMVVARGSNKYDSVENVVNDLREIKDPKELKSAKTEDRASVASDFKFNLSSSVDTLGNALGNAFDGVTGGTVSKLDVLEKEVNELNKKVK